jgi:GAF domain-containing protein/CheY-like chemotaxis protein
VAATGIPDDALPAFSVLGGRPMIDVMRRALETREPVIAMAGGPDFGIPTRVAKTFDIHALLVVPLVSRGRLIGAMAVHTPGRTVQFRDADVALARGIAAHAAAAIDAARLVRATHARLHETKAWRAVSEVLGSTRDTPETMRRVAREIGQVLGADMVGAYLADPDGGALRPIAGYHVPADLIPSFLEYPLPIKDSPGHEALWRDRRPFWSADAAADRRLDPGMVRRFPHRSNLVVPMLVNGEPIGVFVVIWWRDSRVITPDELRLVEGISEQAALFLTTVRLNEALEARLAQERETRLRLERSERRQAAFAEIVEELAAETDLDGLFALIARRGCELVEADAAAMSLVEGDDLVLRGQWGFPDLSGVATRRPITKSRLARVIRDRRVYASEDLAADPVWRDSVVVRELGYRAVLELPIFLHGEVIGVMSALQRTPRRYSEEDIRSLGALAEHSALAVDRANLREQRESRLRETERLLAVSQAVAATLDVTEIARRTLREMVRALAADLGGAWMLPPGGEEFIALAGYHVPPSLLEDTEAFAPLAASHPLIAAAQRLETPLAFPDSQGDPHLDHPILHRIPHRSLLICPMRLGKDMVGGFALVWVQRAHVFTADELRLVEGMARQAAVGIANARLLAAEREAREDLAVLADENARLFAQTQARLRETETLLALGETVIPAIDLAERMRLLARGASRAFGADTVGAYLADAEGLHLVPIAGYHVPPGLREDFVRYPIPLAGHAALEEAWHGRAPGATVDMQNDPRILAEVRRRFPARSVVFAPIVTQERPIGGLFLVWWAHEHALTPDERKLLGAICRHGALFVENARLYAEATGRRLDAEELARQARKLTENLDVAEVGRRTAESALLLLGGVASTLRLLQPDRTLALVASSGDSGWVVQIPLPLDRDVSPTAWAALSRTPVWSADVLADAGYSENVRRREIGSLALVVVPLQLKGELIGVLSIADRAGRVFQDREVELLKAFADQAAIALENSRLYGDLRDALNRVEESQRRVGQGERLRALGELAGGVAHDFNNALAVVVGRAEALLAATDDPALRQHLDVIMQVTFDAAHTVRRIQEFTRKRLARPFQPVDLNELVGEVVEVTRSRWKDAAQARGVRYEVAVECGALPEVAGEPSELREALTNIVFNALDAMPSGGSVSLRTGVDGDRVFCAVRDTGIGMPEIVRLRVFDPFFTTKGERGTGLGLSVVYGIVGRHGGEIDVQSRLGAGSVFTLRLPIRSPVSAEAASPTPPTPPALPRAARVLVVDDEKEVRDVLTAVLTRDGHAVVTCETGDQALTHLDRSAFDLVITDLGMPGLSGWDVVRAVKARRPGTPVAMVTGWGEQIDPAQAGSDGVDYLISKPFRRNDICIMVAAALAGRS